MENLSQARAKELIIEKSFALGFSHVGFSQATFLEKEARYLEKWLKAGKHGSMAYMENNFDKRVDPRKLVEGTQTIISLLFNYFQKQALELEGPKKVSRYAIGEDYHRILKNKLSQLEEFIKELFPGAQTRSFVDSAPVMDKVWAARSGLGWIGKNTNLIVKGKGSWFFIGEIITDIPFPYDLPHADFCGTCQKCIEACPTGALQPYEIDATLCISYWTIEWKGMLREEWKSKMENWAFGCDICQEVCPWNRFAQPTQEIKFLPLPFFHEFQSENWKNLSERAYRRLVAHSPLSRIRLKKWLNNLGIQ
ncbi:MAG: tRNA epoxyqueuosine(34) reductase QueG [Bacteroidia bacterium]|nr:tRNA epoxyqueuosine(34) reductase QueG [Bacteroidia bacterium]MDW8157304.1 tRNA epoxyqueuosine(34) reductase QueG [Bacteroidia bacterium]